MKIYFAGANIAKFSKDNWDNILLSYANEFAQDIEKYRRNKREITYKHLFLDSGAFSAFTQGIKIDIDKYIEFIKQIDSDDIYANLDVIGDEEATYQNWLYMKSKGLNPLPVIHYGADKKWFEIYLKEHKVDYLALGGLVPYTKQRKKLQNWLDFSYCQIRPYFPVRTHLFGITTNWVLERYPAYSCDSTGWLAGTKFNRIVKYVKLGLKEDTELKRYNSSLLGANGRIKNIRNIEQYEKMIGDITKLWEKRGIVWD